MPLEYLVSEKGHLKFIHDSYLFTVERESAGKTIWVCDRKSEKKCKARVHTADGEVVKVLHNHNHANPPTVVEAAQIQDRMRQKAADTMDNSRDIIATCTVGASAGASAGLPSETNMRRWIQRIRVRAIQAPANPQSLVDLVIPPDYEVTATNEQFLQYDSGPGNDRMLVFASPDALTLLSQSRHFFADGTFKVTPPLYSEHGQLFTIHVLVEGQNFPVVYALLPDKRKETYLRLLEAIRDLPGVTFDPETILTDFEQGSIAAFRETFPAARLRACFFHLGQACWRKITELGWRNQYTGDAEFSLLCRMAPALAYVPPGEIVQAFRDFAACIPDRYDLDQYLSYFESTFNLRLLEAIRDLPGVTFDPETILTDFEQGSIAAFRETFPAARLRACFFHLGQACWRKITELGWRNQYTGDAEFSLLCRMAPALAYVPPGEIVQAFRDFAACIPDRYDLDQYLSYFESTFIGPIIAGRQRNAMFPPALWSQHDATVQGLPRTNNAVEGWHNAFQGSVGGYHQSLWRFIDSIKKEESFYQFRLNQLTTGHPPPPKKRRYVDYDARIVNRVNTFGTVNIIPYLRSVAHNVKL